MVQEVKYLIDIPKSRYNSLPKEVIEKEVIHKFLSELPFEKLKELVHLKTLNPKDSDIMSDSNEDIETLQKLRYERKVRVTCKIFLDVGEEPIK